MGNTMLFRLRLFVSFFLLFFLTACDNRKETADAPKEETVTPGERPVRDCRKLRNEALVMDSMLLAATEAEDSLGTRALASFTAFGFNCTYDSLSPVYLIKAAQVARAVKKPVHARQSLEACISEYKDFKDRPAAMFLLAQLYEEESFMQDRDKARGLYKDIISEYPRSVWAQNAKAALTMVGKSEEEIIKMLKGKN